jgi:hypothetical protein
MERMRRPWLISRYVLFFRQDGQKEGGEGVVPENGHPEAGKDEEERVPFFLK